MHESPPSRPITILIAALGGEGGGVLTDWIVRAAQGRGYPVQSTSIPGVAQRTGATTYYIELVPAAAAAGSPSPVLALSPGIGDIDLMVASELLEAGRAIVNGYVTPDRTTLIASTHRVFVTTEKMAMRDGRYDGERLITTAGENARRALLLDLDDIARQAGAMINSVLLGAIAASGILPIARDQFEAAIRADGRSVESNLRGFRAGLDALGAGNAPHPVAGPGTPATGRQSQPRFEEEIARAPQAARAVMREGVKRLCAYQDDAYAALYLDRLRPVASADTDGGAGGELLREVARHLAIRMSYEDLIRVAEAKIDPARRERVAKELGAGAGEPFHVTEFLKPGIEEFCSVMPPRLARVVLRRAQRSERLRTFQRGMEVQTTSVSGFLRFWALAKLRRWRRGTFRYGEEQVAIEAWLSMVLEGARLSPSLGYSVAECAGLIRGYSGTLKRGISNYDAIVEALIRPTLAGRYAPSFGADAIASARAAALADPEGEALATCLAEIRSRAPVSMAAE